MYRFCVLSMLDLFAYGIPSDTSIFKYGVNAAENQFPYFALLVIGRKVNNKVVDKNYCGSSIIGNQWLISAAHCFTDIKWDVVDAYMGSNKKLKGKKYSIDPEGVAIFPGHKQEIKNNVRFIHHDVAVLRTTDVIEFTDEIKPIEMTDHEVNPFAIVHEIGFGFIDKVPVFTLQYSVRYVGVKDTCRNLLKDKIGLLDDHTQMCSVPRTANNSGTFCYGEVGSPVVSKAADEEGRRLVGIISHSGCDDTPDVFVNLWYFRDYILESISE